MDIVLIIKKYNKSTNTFILSVKNIIISYSSIDQCNHSIDSSVKN